MNIDVDKRFPRTTLREAIESYQKNPFCVWHRSCKAPVIPGGDRCAYHQAKADRGDFT